MDEKARQLVMKLSFEKKYFISLNAQAFKLGLINDVTSKCLRISW